MYTCHRYVHGMAMAAKQEINKNTAALANNCFLCVKLINLLRHKPEGETELKCEDCRKDGSVVALCIDCELYLCNVCHGYHSNKFNEHNIVDAPSHGLVDRAAASVHRNVLMKKITPVEEMSKNLSKAKGDIIGTEQKVKEQASEIDQEIEKCYFEQLQELKEHHKQLKKQVHDAVSQKVEVLKKKLTDLTLLQDELTELSECIKKTPDHKILSISEQDIENRMQKVNNQYKTLNTQPAVYDTLEFVPNKSCTSLLGDRFTTSTANPLTSEVVNLPGTVYYNCNVEFTVIAKDSKDKICTKGGAQVSVQLKSFTGDVTAGEVRDNNNGSYMASFVAEQAGDAKLSVSINGEQIKGSPYSIVVGSNYQAIDKPSKIVNNSGSMGQPWGVAFGRNGLWAIADHSNHCVYIFNDKDQLVRRFGSNGSKNGQFKNPRGVAFDSHNHLYVVDYSNHRVQKFDTDGNFLLQFGSKGASDGQLNCPCGVTVHNNKLYVADKANKRISVFNGQFCFTFGSDRLACPHDVTISSNNQLLVADCSNHCICAFTLDGRYLGKFGTQGSGSSQLYNPCSLTTDLNGFILVGDGNNRVSVFDKNGHFFHCFGSKGSADGQFSIPCAIALNPNGTIYISDYNIKRIQIFS